MDTVASVPALRCLFRLRQAAILASLLLAACSATAPRAPNRGDEAAGSFIRETAIDFPNALAHATLVNHMGLGNVAAGIDLLYRVADLPDAILDVYIYPAGRFGLDDAVRRGQQGFIDSLQAARDDGTYAEYAVQRTDPFAVTMADGRDLPGVKTKLAVRKESGSELLASRAYLFYRQFYYIKMRMTAPETDAAQLDTIGDAIALELVPKLHMRSMGECVHIHLLPDRKEGTAGSLRPGVEVDVAGTEVMLRISEDPKSVPQHLLNAMKTDLGCIGVRSEWPPLDDGYSRRKLAFGRDQWQASPADGQKPR